jgi:uncharacterized protein (DUF1501 family)
MSTRRQFMVATAAGGAALPLLWHAQLVGAVPYTGNVLVVMFLRGGCDGLSLLPPVADPDYYAARPTVAVPPQVALPLGGPAARSDFAWHPAAARLAHLYAAGRVAVVPAAGSPDHSRSHFDCQDGVESGRPEDRTSVSGGWLGRYLAGTAGADHPLRAFAAEYGLPPSLRGYRAISAPSLDQLGLISWGPEPDWAMQAIRLGYTSDRSGPDLAGWATASVDAVAEVTSLIGGETDPPEGWPDSWFAHRMFTAARLIESGLPVQVATVDLGGWDHHDAMGAAADPGGTTHAKIAELDAAIGAFFERLDLAGAGNRVTLVAMTEFGRRVEENDSGGTDHGYGGPMVVVGAGVNPGVHGAWPGVATAALADGDLAVTVDQRTVLAELLARRFGAPDLTSVFPGFDTPSAGWVGVGL